MTHGLRRLPAAPPFDLWLVDLDGGFVDAGNPADALDTLDDLERARAARFAFERDRRRWIAARRALRHLLGLRTHTPAAQLRFGEGAFGKPHLLGHPDCAFSLSHSDRFALIAIGGDAVPGGGGEVGVDLELHKPLPDLAELARHCFTREERHAIEKMPADRRERSFLSVWTRKEACLKALGYGLQIEPASFAAGVSEACDNHVPDERTIEIDTPSGIKTVIVASLELPGPIVGALARVRVSPPTRGVRQWQ
jgi:4'-phosphopantetheinyl transferase